MVRKNRLTNLKAPKKKTGPKRVFTEQDLRAVEHLSKLGATDTQIASFFNVTKSAVEYWMRMYPDYAEARKRGGLEADMLVAESLFKRAVGIEYIEEEYTAIEIKGKPVPLDQMARVKRTKKWLPPDVKAATRWLTARQREQWTVVPEAVLRHVGNVNHLHKRIEDIPVQELSPDAQKLLLEISQKSLSAAEDAVVVQDEEQQNQ